MTAFGGVATGNINANDDAMAAGSMIYSGSAFIVNACKSQNRNIKRILF